MPPITDDDDVNLDDLDTDVTDQVEGDGPENEEDLPDGDEAEDERDSDGPAEDDDESGRGGEVDRAAASRDRGDRQEPARRGGRENNRVRALNDELRREREERLALQRRFDEFATRQQQQRAPQESEAERNARRALMSETERMAEDLRASEQRTQQMLQQTTYTVQDSADKSIFEAKAVSDPLYKKWGPKVEAERQRLAQQGANVSREAILRYMLGDAALQSRGSKTNDTARAMGRRRVERQRVRPNDTRNDATQQRRGGRSLEDRLADTPL